MFSGRTTLFVADKFSSLEELALSLAPNPLLLNDMWALNKGNTRNALIAPWKLLYACTQEGAQERERSEMGYPSSEPTVYPGPRFGAATWTQTSNEHGAVAWMFGGIGKYTSEAPGSPLYRDRGNAAGCNADFVGKTVDALCDLWQWKHSVFDETDWIRDGHGDERARDESERKSGWSGESWTNGNTGWRFLGARCDKTARLAEAQLFVRQAWLFGQSHQLGPTALSSAWPPRMAGSATTWLDYNSLWMFGGAGYGGGISLPFTKFPPGAHCTANMWRLDLDLQPSWPRRLSGGQQIPHPSAAGANVPLMAWTHTDSAARDVPLDLLTWPPALCGGYATDVYTSPSIEFVLGGWSGAFDAECGMWNAGCSKLTYTLRARPNV
jgi:hypothetical protein